MEEGDLMVSDGRPLEISKGEELCQVAFHSNLNVILAGTRDGKVFVVDPTLGEVVYETKICKDQTDEDCDFTVGPDKVIVVKGEKVGVRSEYNGILLLDTILQTPVNSSSDIIQIELYKAEAESLLQSLPSVETEPDAAEVEKQLKALIGKDGEELCPIRGVKKEKWCIVKLELPLSVLRSTFTAMVHDLWKKSAYIPQLSIASTILERLNLLHVIKNDPDSALDKNQMFSESARLNTFATWPHMDYKWALPEKMAQAGFYHSPSSNGEDRAMCFTCNVCLVSWEPTDEPWSEHERHSPFCPFVRGEHTHNVPLSLTCATLPAFVVDLHSAYPGVPYKHPGVPILGRSSVHNAMVVGYSTGLVVVWEIGKQTKEFSRIVVSSRGTFQNEMEPSPTTSYCDIALKPKEAWVMDTSESLQEVMKLAKQCLANNVRAEETFELQSVCVIGTQPDKVKEDENLPPTFVAGGTVTTLPAGPDAEPSYMPYLLVYGMSKCLTSASSVVQSSQKSCDTDELYSSTGSTGTKQESQTFDDDAFGSYVSDGVLLSDSVSIFSDMNVSDASGSTFVLDPVGIEGEMPSFLQKKKGSATSTPKKSDSSKSKRTPIIEVSIPTFSGEPLDYVIQLQKLTVPTEFAHCCVVQAILPNPEGTHIVVYLKSKSNQSSDSSFSGVLLSYEIIYDVKHIILNEDYVALKKIQSMEELPTGSFCFIPSSESGDSLLASVLKNGSVKIFNVTDFSTKSAIERPENASIVSISYVSSLEKICCGTDKGTLELYPLTASSEADLLEDSVKLECNTSDTLGQSQKLLFPPIDHPDLLVNKQFTLESLNELLALTTFENLKPMFSANAPSCWIKVIQAQKERKHPQHLQHNEVELNSSTLTWRLQKTKFSRQEHLFEITLPKSTRVGHIDLKFILQTGCIASYLPEIEVTLYRSSSNRPQSSSSCAFKNPSASAAAISDDFLKSINAEIVCGPLDICTHVDLSAQGGTVVMTSPTLILKKGRNFYLHIRAKNVVQMDNSTPVSSEIATNASSGPANFNYTQSSTQFCPSSTSASFAIQMPTVVKSKPPVSIKTNVYDGLKPHHMYKPWAKHPKPEMFVDFLPSFTSSSHSPSSLSNMKLMGTLSSTCVNSQQQTQPPECEKKKDYHGCDWLNEISITIRQVKLTSHPHEEIERKALLTSEAVFHKLLTLAALEGDDCSAMLQVAALDLLVWIAAVNLCGPPIGSSDIQSQFVTAVQSKLDELIMNGILMSDRSTAHKCAKLLVLCIDAIETHGIQLEDGSNFLLNVLHSLLDLLPYTLSCTSAGSLQWYFLLLNRVRSENLGRASEAVLNILKDVSFELRKRTVPLHALLRTRFGLYGTPFEPELFEIELPPVTKSYSHPLTYAGLYGSDHSSSSLGSGTFHLWGLKDVDFRDLLIGNPLNLRWGKVGMLSPKQQIQGLLEVEPLHFTCHATSDGTRIEKIDLGVSSSSFSTVPLPQPWENFTNMPTGEGSKKSEPDKLEHIMMLHKALDNTDIMYDMINDLKFMENKLKMVDIPYSNPDIAAALAHATSAIGSGTGLPGNVLNVVMNPSLQSSSSGPGAPKNVYVPVLQSYGGLNQSLPKLQPIIEYTQVSQGPGPSKFKYVAPLKLIDTKSQSSSSDVSSTTSHSKADNDGLRLLLSPWQQMMYAPPQQAIVIDRMHSGARRFVVLDFGAPVLLTDMIIPSCNDLVSLSIDIWVHREDTDGQRLIVASDIGSRTLVVSDLQPPAVCRYLKITVIGRYGMGTTKCRIPLGMFYGHTTVLPSDIRVGTKVPDYVPVLSPGNIQAHLSVLSYLVEDIGCRYQLACSKLRKLLEPLLKPEISALDHISYYLPKGKERNKLGLNNSSDQVILSSYQECIILQQQLNVAKNVVRRLQKSLTPNIGRAFKDKPLLTLDDICTDKVHLLSEFLIESLLGISFLASNAPSIPKTIPYSMYSHMNQEVCENLFRDICVLENGQCQLSTCMLMLRVCGFQQWWGKFLASTLRKLFASGSNSLFPQDRVFILLVYLGQKSVLSWQNSNVLESALELLVELLSPMEESKGFLSSKLDMTLLGWVVMYLCLCLDGVNCTLMSDLNSCPNSSNNGSKKQKDRDAKEVGCVSSRWDFIQGESALFRRIAGSNKPTNLSGIRRRIQKKVFVTKQKLEELDNVASGLSQVAHLPSDLGIGMQLSALGNKIEAIKQKQANIGKSIKLQSSKHFKDLLQIRKNELLLKRGMLNLNGKNGKEETCQTADIEINLNLDPKLCSNVTKGLGLLLLRMDSTCHSDVYLITCKALARIATACRPVISLGSIFTAKQLIGLILNAVGSDYVRQKNWSSPWVSHSVMCLIQDILEAEKLFPLKTDDKQEPEAANAASDDILSGVDDSSTATSGGSIVEDIAMAIDEVDSELGNANELLGGIVGTNLQDNTMSCESEDSDFEDLGVQFTFGSGDPKITSAGTLKKHSNSLGRKLSPCITSISTALDARLENGVESTTEIRLRMMAVVDCEVLSQSLKAPIEVPSDVLKNATTVKPASPETPGMTSSPPSCSLLSECFEKMFQMMASENCSVSIEKILQLWISINLETSGIDDTHDIKPLVPLSPTSVSHLMAAFTKNAGIGVQEWGLVFQCLYLVSNQRALTSTNGMWLYILSDKCFPEMILRFISGTGMNIQKNNVASAGPTVCQHFYNFLLRLRHLSSDTPWTPCLKEILLRVLSLFLSGPFTTAEFPLDAFNKFLDRLTCPDLSYVNPATVISLMQQIAQILHQYIFCPNKLTVKPGGDLKCLNQPTTSANCTNNGGGDNKSSKSQTFDNAIFRLVSFMASFVSLPFKSVLSSDGVIQEFLSQMSKPFHLSEYENALVHYIAKCGDTQPKTIADIVLQMDSTMMRMLSVLANPNSINVLVSGDLVTAFSIMENSTPTTVVDSVIHLFSKIQTNASHSKWLIEPIFRFLTKTPYDDFCCPLIVSETFVLMVLKVISTEENLSHFAELKCVEAVCEKFVISARKFFSSCPTFVSILTQYIGRTDTNALFGMGHKKIGNDSIELQEGQINVAPLGTITSNNFSAHPSEVLLQATPPHRRARTPVWSYHFFPEETFLELVISLPCAVLLREVHVVPHMTSLSTCPSAIMIEISRDKSNLTLPMGPPVNCCGMSNITIQLTQPEVAQTVLLRLFKPKDSSNLGLSQIRLLGSTTFSEAALQGLSAVESVRSFESSAHWMYILDRAISVSESNPALRRRIIETAVNIPDVLESCYSMLIAPVVNGKAQDIYLPHVASVLFHFGNLRRDVSEQLISALLGPVQMGFAHGMVASSNPQTGGSVSQLSIVVELLFKLCCYVPQWGFDNLVAVVTWLESCVDNNDPNVVASPATPEYFQAVAAALWEIAAIGKADLSEICTAKLLWKLYKWSIKLDGESELKVALDHVMCSICYSRPWLFIYLLTRMQVVKQMDWTEKDQPIEDLLHQWYDDGCMWERVQLEDIFVIRNSLTSSKLMTLGRAAQSPMACRMLQESQLLVQLNASIMDFWNHHSNRWLNVAMSAEQKDVISPRFLIAILSFYGELCKITDLKTWFGSHGSIFWRPILTLLSTLPGSVKINLFGSDVYDLESVVISYLSKCCWSHPENQSIIATCLREIIISQKSTPHKAVFLHSMSSFCRRLLIQLLLENEKVIVHVKSQSKYPLKTPGNSLPLKDKHPSMGVTGGDRIFLMSTHSLAVELMKSIEPHGVKLEKLGISIVERNKFLSMLGKDQGLIDAGLEMIDHMQMVFTGIAAKDKRASTTDLKRPIKLASKKLKPDGAGDAKPTGEDKIKGPTMILELEEFPGVSIPTNVSIATLMAAVRHQKAEMFLDTLVFTIRTEMTSESSQITPSSSSTNMEESFDTCASSSTKPKEEIPDILNIEPLPSTVEVFSRLGGLGLLAKHLPVVYPETLRQIAVGNKLTGSVGLVMNFDKDSPMGDNEWVKIENPDEFYDDMLDGMVASTPIAKRAPGIKQLSSGPGIPPHSMAAFGLFLSLPRFSEVLLGERTGAQCMLRLVMGVTDDADGNDIFGSEIAKTLPTLPFVVLRCLLDAMSLNIVEGRELRRAMVDVKAVHFILACLAVFTHQNCDASLVPGIHHELVIAATKAQSGYPEHKGSKSDDKSHVYWAKGTGFGTGSTAQSWDVEMAMQKKNAEEENVTCLLHLLSSFINPIATRSDGSSSEEDSALPPEVLDLLRSSCLFSAIAGYLRNDSVLDMARHVPLYKSVLKFLRSLVSNQQFIPLLAPWERRSGPSSEDQCISSLLSKMKDVVDNYSRRLTCSKGRGVKAKTTCKALEELEDEGLAQLIPDIQSTASLVEKSVAELAKKHGNSDIEMADDNSRQEAPIKKTVEERYIQDMKQLQFAFYEMISEDDDGTGIRFTVPYHYESQVRTNWGRTFPARLKRLAQESVTLSTSLPIAYGSTIFVRCDNDRLDVMKVLITGPSGTPYSNGCFEFDVFFPNDYPNAPMMINLETNGRQRVRFNPNLYTDGKVCLSILNTWHGRPEEKWNPQTSSLLPVLVAIQSLILNAEPYFNEPGYEKSRGTDQGERNSREYNVGIQIATVEWAMLDQLRHPSPCFKDIIQRHFWVKKAEIIAQCDKWLEEITIICRNDKRAGKNVTGASDPVTVYKNNLILLKKELNNLKPPPGLEDLATSSVTEEQPGSSSVSLNSSETPPRVSEAQLVEEGGSSSSGVSSLKAVATAYMDAPTNPANTPLTSANSTPKDIESQSDAEEQEKVEGDEKMSVDV